jgi:hypothetical protein
VRPTEQEEPDRHHHQQPEEKAWKCRPLCEVGVASGQKDRDPKRRRLNNVADHAMRDYAYDEQGRDNQDAAENDDAEVALH